MVVVGVAERLEFIRCELAPSESHVGEALKARLDDPQQQLARRLVR
jgi:hypothetical protein